MQKETYETSRKVYFRMMTNPFEYYVRQSRNSDGNQYQMMVLVHRALLHLMPRVACVPDFTFNRDFIYF